MIQSAIKLIAPLLLAVALVNESFALGIRQPEQGAAATGQNDAFVAQADDPSAVYYNPAGLTQIKGTVTMSGAYFNSADAKFTGRGDADGTSKKTQDTISILPHVYAVSDFGVEWFRGGIGVYTPFGQSLDWGNNNSFRYVTTRSELQMINVNPTVAFQINENLSIGLGYDYYHAETDLRRAFPFVVPGLGFVGEGNFSFVGNGGGHGYNAGLLWKINEQHRIGIAYRSSVEVEFDGDARVRKIPGFLGMGSSVKADGKSDFEFPSIVQFGYAFWPTPRWKIEADADWTNWDVVNRIALKSKGLQSAFGLTQEQLRTKLDWEDSWIVMLGTQYEINSHVLVRGGWYWSENSVPENTYSPFLPDSDRTGVSVGLGLRYKNWTVDLAAQLNFSLDRTVKNDVGSNPDPVANQSVDGKYESYSIGGAVSVGYHF